MNRNRVLTVSQLTQSVKECLESSFPALSVQGEISNFRRQSSGHCYFSLKDAHAQVSAVMFRRDAAQLSCLPKDGDQVTVCGQLNVYAPRGQYQLVVRSVQQTGVGELLLKLEKLKQKLAALGWFESSLKQALPAFPKRVGVVTSPTGAALQDMLNVLRRRQGAFSLLLNPARVQGREAASEIAHAIEEFNTHKLVDVMIVGRGGGSLEDLWPFNEERVAAAIHASRIPVISAVGHETDWTLSDLVADLRAPTPSAAAEMVMAERAARLDFLSVSRNRLQQTVSHHLKRVREQLRRFETHPLLVSPYQLLGRAIQQCDDLKSELDRSIKARLLQRKLALQGLYGQTRALCPLSRLLLQRTRLDRVDATLRSSLKQQLLAFREKLTRLASHLSSIDPKNLLRKGYAILFDEKENRVVSSAHRLSAGQLVHVRLADGRAQLKVETVTT